MELPTTEYITHAERNIITNVVSQTQVLARNLLVQQEVSSSSGGEEDDLQTGVAVFVPTPTENFSGASDSD